MAKEVKHTTFRNCPVCNTNSGEIIINLNNTDLIRCSGCSMVFADIKENIVLDKNVYNKETFYRYLQKEHFITAAYYDFILKKIIRYFKTKQIKMLEFGCGSGQFLLRAKRKGIKAYGSDFSPYSEIAKKEFNLKIETKDIFNTDYKPGSFDVIISHATYEHVYDLNKTTEKLSTLLKKEGLMIISGIPNFNLLSRRWLKNYHINTPPGHINYFETNTVQRLFKNHKLIPFKTHSYGIDIWFVKNQINKIFKKNEITKLKNQTEIQKGKENLLDFKNTERNVKISHKIFAFLYRSYGFIFPGKSIESWAIKK